jgi:hypothetical protein
MAFLAFKRIGLFLANCVDLKRESGIEIHELL